MQFPGVPIINDKLSIVQTTDLMIFHIEWILLSSAWLMLGILQFSVANILSALNSAFILKVLANDGREKFSNWYSVV